MNKTKLELASCTDIQTAFIIAKYFYTNTIYIYGYWSLVRRVTSER